MAKIFINISDEDYLKIKNLGNYEDSPFKFSEMFDFCDIILNAVNNGTVVEEDNNDLANDYWKSTGYLEGIKDAWEAAKKIVCPPDCYEGGLYHKMKDIFGVDGHLARSVFINNSAEEAIQKIKEYEENIEDDDFTIGDEIIHSVSHCKGIIFYILPDVEKYPYRILWSNGNVSIESKYAIEKTGKHYDEFLNILDSLKEDNNETT